MALNVPGISPSQACGELSKKSLDRCRMNIMVGQANTVGTGQIPGACPTNISAFQPAKHNVFLQLAKLDLNKPPRDCFNF